MTQHSTRRLLALLFVVLAVVATACSTEAPTDEVTDAGDEAGDTGATEAGDTADADTTDAGATDADAGATEGGATEGGDSAGSGATSDGRDSEWFDAEEFDRQLAQRDITPEGPEGEPWAQAIEPEMADTSEYASEEEGGWHVCFSNAGVNNPWRVVGFTTMQQELELHENISEFTHVDAEGSDEKQISDIQGLLEESAGCDALIVSPNTTSALTPAVEQACETGIPVIVFDRGVNTDCPVTFIHPIGGYAFGATAAEFLVDNVEEGGNILALRILPGVDVLETRWVAGQVIMEEAGLNIVGAEFTEGDSARVNQIVTDYLQRGDIDGVWMDAGANAVAAAEAFEDAGLEVPPMNGEDQNDFLLKWQEDGLTAVAPTYPTFQWRTPIIAADMILSGEEVPSEWVLPQPTVTQENLDQYAAPELPPLFYALCGCQDMPNFPEAWQ